MNLFYKQHKIPSKIYSHGIYLTTRIIFILLSITYFIYSYFSLKEWILFSKKEDIFIILFMFFYFLYLDERGVVYS
jgi:hypothetical protein